MEKFYRYFKQFAVLAICYIVAVFVVKTCELLVYTANVASLSGFIYCNLISCGFVAAVVFVIYSLISILSRKTATYVSAVLFGAMVLTEMGLVIYHATTGILMGKELIIRPLWEMIHTVQNAVSIWMIIGVVVLLVAYVVLSVWLSRKSISKLTSLIVSVVILASIPLFFLINTNQNKIVVNKTFYCVRQCLRSDFEVATADYDVEIINKYIEMFPNRKVIDYQYPLEREDNIGNVLGPYFKKSEVKPDIVVIIVESLGADLFGDGKDKSCFVPFLDSLSKHSLLWMNCMATTPRSFGAVPAITGSVPHGLKGFQFGDIPNHNSLFTILAKNGYSTNAFYTGNFSFDRVYDYLVAQNIDYMSPFYAEYNNDKSKERDGSYWGYNDDVMLQKSLQVIEQHDDRPAIDLLVTMSMHEDLKLYDKDLQKKYYEKAESLGASSNVVGMMAGTLYTDDALRHFMKGYCDYDKDGNTIFIITGDHSMNLNPGNPLNAYQVPLIIWSPLLEKPARFDGMVSHNDITPTVLALLRENYGLETPPTVSWVSDGLDTVSGFHSNVRNYFLHYSRELRDFVWNDYYYTMDNKTHPVSRIVDGVNLEYFDNQSLSEELKDKFETMVYVDNYVYSQNKIVKNPVLDNKNSFELIRKVSIPDSIYCASKPEKPSVMKPESIGIFRKKMSGKYSEIKLVMTADIMYTGYVWQDKFINLIVDCSGDNMERVYSSDYISKYIMSRIPERDKWQKLQMSKIISINESNNIELTIFLLPTYKDDLWNPEHTVTLKNVEIEFFGLTNQ